MSDDATNGLTPVRVYRKGAGAVPYTGARSVVASATIQPARMETPPIAQKAAAAPPPAGSSASTGIGATVGLMIFCAAIIALVSMGLRNVFTLWQSPMMAELGWTSATFSIAIAAQNLIWGMAAPFFGAIADRFGARPTVVFGALLQAAGLWVMSRASDPALFFLSAGVMIGMAQAAGGMGILLGAVGRVVHERHRPLAFGIITSASSAGMIVITPIGQAFLETMTWSEAFVALAILCLPLVLLALFIGGRQRPGDPSTAAIAHMTVGQALGEAFAHRGYMLLVLGFFVCGFHVTFIGLHLSNNVNDVGLGLETGARVLMVIGVFNVAACLAVGPLAAIFRKKNVLAWIYLLRAAAILAFIMAPVSEWSVYAFAASIGVLWLSTVPLTQALVAQLFGTQYMTMLFGVVFFSHQIGGFLGAYGGAWAFDTYGSYDLAWYVGIGLGLFAAVCHVLIDERPAPRLRAATA